MTQDVNRCIFCDELHMEGIHLRGKFICSKCEKELLEIQVDEPEYDVYKEGLKVIWVDQTEKSAPEAQPGHPENSNPV